MKTFSLTAVLVLFVARGLFAQAPDGLAHADSLFDNYQEKESLAAYNEVLDENPNNLSALWHASLLYSRIGNRLDDDDEMKMYYNNAKDLAQRALAVDSTSADANFVMAVAMGRMALIVGSRERVAASRDIKKYADRALEADSTNAGAWHVLGRWNYEISNLNFAERLAANVLFGGIPEGASTEKAVEYINKAIALNPKFVLYYYDLAKAYEELGEDEQAVEACKTGLEKSTLLPGDEIIHEDCRELIDDLE